MRFSISDVMRGYDWLGQTTGVTEVCMLHPDYRRADPARNRAHRSWPITTYITTSTELLHLVRQYAGERLLCYGINPRPQILTRPDGRLRSARQDDITTVQNLVLDLDLEGAPTPSRLAALTRFLSK